MLKVACDLKKTLFALSGALFFSLPLNLLMGGAQPLLAVVL